MSRSNATSKASSLRRAIALSSAALAISGCPQVLGTLQQGQLGNSGSSSQLPGAGPTRAPSSGDDASPSPAPTASPSSQPAAPPVLAGALEPGSLFWVDNAPVGQTITLYGYFPAAGGPLTVTFGGNVSAVASNVTSGALLPATLGVAVQDLGGPYDQAQVVVPAGAQSGPVTVSEGGQASNGLPFRILAGFTIATSSVSVTAGHQLDLGALVSAQDTAGAAVVEEASGSDLVHSRPFLTWSVPSGSPHESVDARGVLTAIDAGQTTVWVGEPGIASRSVAVTIVPAVSSVALATVQGTLFDPRQTAASGLSGGQVSEVASGGAAVGTWTTDAYGGFYLPVPALASCSLTLGASGFVTETYPILSGAAGSAIALGNIPMIAQGSTGSGTALAQVVSASGQTVASLSVTVRSGLGVVSGSSVATTQTDGTGSFAVVVPTGVYTAEVDLAAGARFFALGSVGGVTTATQSLWVP